MGFITAAPNGNPRANWRDPAGRQRAKTFKTKKEARAFLAQVEADKRRGHYVDPAAGRVKFADHAERWLAARNDEITTAARDASIMRNHVVAQWGALPLDRIEHMAVQEWVTNLGRRYSRATVAECFRLTSGVMRSAVRNRLIPFNPCEEVRLPKRRKHDTDDPLISMDELTGKLLPEIPERYRVLVGLAGGGGLRWGEAIAVRWDVVDLAAGILRVVRVAVEVSGHVTDKPYPKSRAGRREVPIPAFLAELLVQHRAKFPAGSRGEVTTNSTGGPLWRGSFRSRVWKPALRRAGLPEELTYHGLRHCYSTWLVSDGLPVNVVQAVMGHEDASTTLGLYTHLPKGYVERVRGAFADNPLTLASEPGSETEEGPSEEGP